MINKDAKYIRHPTLSLITIPKNEQTNAIVEIIIPAVFILFL